MLRSLRVRSFIFRYEGFCSSIDYFKSLKSDTKFLLGRKLTIYEKFQGTLENPKKKYILLCLLNDFGTWSTICNSSFRYG